MINLNHIFPVDYPNIPTYEDLEIEVQDMLCRSDNPKQVLCKIQSLDCPYYKEALTRCYNDIWRHMVDRQDPATYYEDGDGHKIANWPEAQYDMKRLIRQLWDEQEAYCKPAIIADTQTLQKAAEVLASTAVTQQLKKSVTQAVTQVCTAEEILAAKPIIVNIQNLYISPTTIHGDNNGTLAGQYTINNRH